MPPKAKSSAFADSRSNAVPSVSSDDVLATQSMLVPTDDNEKKQDEDSASLDDLKSMLPSNTDLLGLLTKMLASQQEQMRLYEKQMLTDRLSSTAMAPSSHPIEKVQLSDFPKFSESICSEEAIQYLGFPKAFLMDEDIRICRAFKFFAFRSKFMAVSLNVSDAARLQTLILCLKGVAQDRAVSVAAKTADQLLDKMNDWYASAADLSLLEDAVRSKLESTRRGRSELLPDYVLPYRQYWDLAKTLPDCCGLSERICVRFFIRTLSSTDADLMAEVIRNRGFACQTLQSVFDLTLDSAKILRLIRGDSHSSHARNGSGPVTHDSDLPSSGYRSNQNNQCSREFSDSFNKRPNAKTNRVSVTVSDAICLDLVVPSKPVTVSASDLYEDREDNPALVNKVQQSDYCLKEDAHVTESVPVSVEIQMGSDRYGFQHWYTMELIFLLLVKIMYLCLIYLTKL